MKRKYLITILMFLATVILLMSTVSAATETESWYLDENTNFTNTNDKSIASGKSDNFNYYAISKYNGTADLGDPYTGYFLATSNNKKNKIKSITLQIYDGNTYQVYTQTFKGNNKNQMLINLGENKTVNVYQDGPMENPIVAQITFQYPTPNSNNNEATNNPTTSATMKTTGIPINLILLVLCSVLATLVSRKQN